MIKPVTAMAPDTAISLLSRRPSIRVVFAVLSFVFATHIAHAQVSTHGIDPQTARAAAAYFADQSGATGLTDDLSAAPQLGFIPLQNFADQGSADDRFAPEDAEPLERNRNAGPLDAEVDAEDNELATSMVETLYRERYQTPAAGDLEQFGYDLFDSGSHGPKPSIAVGPRYVLGPGDELKVRIWGAREDLTARARVADDGRVDIPRLGVMQAAGLTVARFEQDTKGRAVAFFQGVEVDVSLLGLRDVQVFVVGEVERPGLQLLPASSTALTALVAAGGVKKTGSLRRLLVRRGGAIAARIDLYDLLLNGSMAGDVVLADGDVVFAPRIGPTAAVVGGVLSPGVYELLNETTADQLPALAGGVLPQALGGRILLRRFEDNARFTVQDVAHADDLARTPLLPGDMLELGFVVSDRPDAVRLRGHVARPDSFEYQPDLKLSDILTGPELLLPEAIVEFALLHRYDPDTTRSRVATFPLGMVFHNRFDAPLAPFDEVEVLSREAYGISAPVRVGGAVWQNGTLSHTPGMRLMDALARSGGLSFGADSSRIEISRKIVSNGVADTAHFLVDFLQRPDFELKPYDYVFAPRAKDATGFRTMRISGEVRYPGTYRIRDGERLSSVLERAGSFTENAYFFGAEYTSRKAREIQQENLDRLIRELRIRTQQIIAEQSQIAVDPAEAGVAGAAAQGIRSLIERMEDVTAEGRVSIRLAHLGSFRGSAFDFEVADGDALHVPAKPNFVSVMGSVHSPGAFLHRPELSVDDYLEKSGGFTKTADGDALYVVKANGEVLSRAQRQVSRRSFLRTQLMPGDTVVAPEDLERIPYLRIFRDVADILFKIATTAGVAFALL